MGKELFKWMRGSTKIGNFDPQESADYLEARFGSNIEDIFNGIQVEINKRNVDYLVLANSHRPCLIEAMRQWFADIHQKYPATTYETFASKIVKPGDGIITFNYDVSVDAKLRQSGKWSIGDGYGFAAEGLPTGSTVKILKLHGSINWLAPMFVGAGGGVFGERPVFTDRDLTALGYLKLSDNRFPRPFSGVGTPLVLPTNRKQFFFDTNLGREWDWFWERLWRAARRLVQTSERIVICGYGMYPVDRRGSNLLLKGDLEGDVEVCCGGRSACIVQQLQDHGRRAHQAEQTRFEDWVSART
jgi:hypothetical protein